MSPTLPQHLIARHLELDIADDAFSFDMTHVERMCIGTKPVARSNNTLLTYEFNGCAKRTLTFIPLDKVDCAPPERSAVLRIVAPEACGAKFSILEKSEDGKSRRLLESVPGEAGLDVVVKHGARVIGSVHVDAVLATNATSEGSASAAILREARGKIEMAASSMSLDALAVGHDRALRASFADADMGFVTDAEANDNWQLGKWRLQRFGAALIFTFGVLVGLRRLLLERPCKTPTPSDAKPEATPGPVQP